MQSKLADRNWWSSVNNRVFADGYGSSVYEKDNMFGIMVRNSFNSIDEFEEQLDVLLNNENTSLLLLPIKEIKIQIEDGNYLVQ